MGSADYCNEQVMNIHLWSICSPDSPDVYLVVCTDYTQPMSVAEIVYTRFTSGATIQGVQKSARSAKRGWN